MIQIESSFDGQTLTISLSGHINNDNAHRLKTKLMAEHNAHPAAPMVLDCSNLDYISSAGLRVVLSLLKIVSSLSIINASPEVYQILEMTGFTMMMEVRKAYRRLSVKGCSVIGRGAKGTLYRLNDETVCKVYHDPDSLEEINRERDLARSAFIAGIPTAISYEVVRVGDGYGSVFELLNADTMGDLLAKGVWDVERVASASADLLLQMAQTNMDSCALPSAREEAFGWVDMLQDVLSAATYSRLRTLVEEMPDSPYMVHGDFHMGNVMVQNDEPLLIDMETLSHGNGIFDLTTAYSAYVGRGLLNRRNVEKYLGVSYKLSCHLWDLILRGRFLEASDNQLQAAQDKIRLLSSVRLMGRPLRHKGIKMTVAKRTYKLYGSIIDELLPRVDTLEL